ncbi:MAG: hypothetical protein QOH04_674 [Sphingomonadales bacterium]|jgi:hypothetical protein|nr:hypothetical protein [Sphingomonadales bacterium]
MVFRLAAFLLHLRHPPPANIAGTWDLTWQTRHGPSRSGWLVVTQQGNRIAAEIHGQGAVKALGEMAGDDFTLRGSRLAIPYTISGRIEGGSLKGSLKVLSIDRRFTGTRR